MAHVAGAFHVDLLAGGKSLRVDEDGIIDFVYFEHIYGSAQFILHCDKENWGDFDQLLTSPDNPVLVRWGYEEASSREDADWRKVYTAFMRSRYEPTNVEIFLEGMDWGQRLHQAYTSSKAYKNMKISDIVSEIADDAGLDADVAPTKGQYHIMRNNLPAAIFIKKELLPRAVSQSGEANFYFYIKEGSTLVFKPPVLENTAETYVLTLPPEQEQPKNVRMVEVEYRRVTLAPLGSLVTEVRGFDPIKVKPISFKADDNTVKFKKLSRQGPTLPIDPARVYLTTAPYYPKYSQEDVENEAKAIWGANARSLWRVTLDVPPKVAIKPFSVVKLEIDDQNGQPHFTAGKYLVRGVKQLITGNEYRTILYLERRTSERGG